MAYVVLAVIYLTAIARGIPDSFFGSAWPSIQQSLGAPLSGASLIYMVVSLGSITANLLNAKIARKVGTGVMMVSFAAVFTLVLFGDSVSSTYWQLCLLSAPYGVCTGLLSANANYHISRHYPTRYISWFSALYGIGTIAGPYIAGWMLSGGNTWNRAYRYLALIQAAVTLILLVSLPLWKKQETPGAAAKAGDGNGSPRMKELLRTPGAKSIFGAFFCYGGLEQTAALWASSYMALARGVDAAEAAKYASLVFIGLTAGRLVNGFLTIRFTDRQMIRTGRALAAVGIVMLMLPLGNGAVPVSLVLVGLGCAPLHPCMLHSTFEAFGADRAREIIGIQIAAGSLGVFVVPPLFGVIADSIGTACYPYVLAVILVLMVILYEAYSRKKA